MPEGHVIHRLADELNGAFSGRVVNLSSPQGRFADAAVLLDGAVLHRAEAYGKHLFIDFGAERGPARFVHIHLGLIGRLSWVEPGTPSGPQTLRLRIQAGDAAIDLRGPQTCELIGEDGYGRVIAGLGPDPLRPDADPERAWSRLHSSTKSVASLLLDQKVMAGVGNIYRCEALFRQRIRPETPGADLTRRRWNRVWTDLVELMPLGVRDARIDTVAAEHLPEAMGREPRRDRHGGEVYVYRRDGQDCLVCGRGIRVRELAGRKLYWCSRCQSR